MISATTIAYQADPSALLSDAVIPLVRAAGGREGIDSAWAQAHWRRGPHTIVYLSGEERAVADVADDLAAALRRYLDEHPSTAILDEDSYLETSIELGRLELVSPPYMPLRPDNSVTTEEAGVIDTFVRGSQAEAAKGRIMAAGLDVLADAVLATGVDPVDAIYSGMSAIATAYPRTGLLSGYQAFLSHWKEHFHWADPEGRLEGALTASFASQRDGLVARLDAVHSDRDAAGRADPVTAAWIDWVALALPLALELARTGDVLPYPHADRYAKAAELGDDVAVRWGGADDRDYSDFHRSFRRLDFTRLGNGTDFAAYRFVINCFFELLPLMGVTPLQRYSVACFFTTASQIVLGEEWPETIERAVQNQYAELGAAHAPTLPWRGESND